jgi:Flp pilus assembly protein TadD
VLKKLLGQLLLQAWRAIWPGRGFWPALARGPSPLPPESLRQAFDARMQADDYDGALALAAGVVERDPNSFEARLLLGRAQQKLHAPERALACFEMARRLRADDAELYDFRGALYQELGRLPEALADYDRALALRPDFPLAAFHLGMARLLVGDYERGWEGYDLRRLSSDFPAAPAAAPRWDGSSLAGRTLLVTREQGLGDEMMFASLLPQLIAQARACIVECDPRLVATLRRSFPAATIFGTEPGGGLPQGLSPASIDLRIEAGSLPRLLRRRAADFARHDGYLRADPQHVARWRARLAELGPGLKVGLAWTGGVRRTRRELRSLPLEQLLPLLRTPGVHFVSLQYTADAGDEIDALRIRHGIQVEHWPEAIDDYDQTAALVCALDLVISVCTSLVHLGGALGRPVWAMVPVGPEWRYGVAGDSMPWYPSVRLFRQAVYQEWGPTIDSVAGKLQTLQAIRFPAAGSALDAARRQGAEHAMQGRYAEAIEVLREALRLAPRQAETANLAGLCCSLTQRYEEALRHYDAALDVEPALTDALANAGWTATLLGRNDANRYFRRWLDAKAVPLHGAQADSQRDRLSLPEVTLCCVDCVYYDHAANALRATLARCSFERALFLSDRDCGVPGVEFVAIERIASREAYSNFMIHRLHEYIHGSHALVIQYDGFVLNPGAWDPEFLRYDYIGPAVRFADGQAGGIGGFSLRSRKLLAALRDDPQIRLYDASKVNYPEDVAICYSFRKLLETRHGIRFAPGEVADRFAAEAIAPTTRTFGFHNLMHLVCLYQNQFRLPEAAADAIRITFRAESALGSISAQREVELRSRGDAWPSFFPSG